MLKIFTIYNTVSKQGGRLFLSRTDEDAKKEFAQWQLGSKLNNPFHRHQDYKLICLGQYFCDIPTEKDSPIKDNMPRIIIREGFPYDVNDIEPFFNPKMYEEPEFKELEARKEREQEIKKAVNYKE